MQKIYLDYNASTPLSESVRQNIEPYLTDLIGNPSSQHWASTGIKSKIQQAREKLAQALSCLPEEIIFTSGGTEANNHAIMGTFFAHSAKGKHIIYSAIEHPAVSETCEYLKKFGAEISVIPINENGIVDPKEIEKQTRPDTVLISIMHSNNEIGSLQPISEIAEIALNKKIIFHTDAAQSIGKVKVDLSKLKVNLMSIAGHKFFAPKGVGALFIRNGTTLDSYLHGANHEDGRRAGTENVPYIIGLGAAAEEIDFLIFDNNQRVRLLKNKLWEQLKEAFKDNIIRNGDDNSLPNTLNVSFVNKIAFDILTKIPEIAASTGSACHSGAHSLSVSMQALGRDHKNGLGSIRFSLGRYNTDLEVQRTIDLFKSRVFY